MSWMGWAFRGIRRFAAPIQRGVRRPQLIQKQGCFDVQAIKGEVRWRQSPARNLAKLLIFQNRIMQRMEPRYLRNVMSPRCQTARGDPSYVDQI